MGVYESHHSNNCNLEVEKLSKLILQFKAQLLCFIGTKCVMGTKKINIILS